MDEVEFMPGNIALAESAIRAGCKYYFGYPITPASEIAEYYALKMPEEKGVFIQSETEVSGANMVAGVVATGKRGMMATSGPGISLSAEAISFMASAGLPAVLVNVMRPGPGDGDIAPAQGDYFQAVKGGGHGDYNLLVLAPYSVQETADLTVEAFDLAEKYRNPVLILTDAMLAKMMEAAKLPERREPKGQFDWALTGAKDRERNIITTCAVNPKQWEEHNMKLQAKFNEIKQNEQRWENYQVEDADIIIVAYGCVARIALTAIKKAREKGLKAGMIRPITLWPYPQKAFENVGKSKYLVVELSAGQMIEDVRLSVKHNDEIHFHGRMGGMVPTPADIYNKIVEIANDRGKDLI